MKKLVSLFLALLMVASLCSFAAADVPADWEPFAERVKITVPVYDRSKAGYPAVDDNYWTQWIQKEFGDKYNIDVQYVAIPRGDVMMKYSTLIAAGETPTIMMEYDYPKVAQWANDGAMTVINLDDFKAVAPTFYQAMVDHNQLGYTDINGETYFVLTERPYYDTTFAFANFVRMDWLRQVGYDHVPQNYEEHKDAMNKMIEAGLCEYPLGLGIPTSPYIVNFGYRDFPVTEEGEKEWAMHSSLGTPSFPWYPTERMMKRLNSEYHMGWYSSEFDLEKNSGGQGTDILQTDFINGKIYSYGGYIATNMAWLSAFYENNPDAELAIASPYAGMEEGINTGAIRADNPFGMIVGFSSLATPEQLKAAWMLMEWMIQPENLFVLENGIEGETYELDENGLPVMLEFSGDHMLNHNNNFDMTCLVHASKKVGTIEQTIAQMSPAGLPQDFTQALIDNYYELRKLADAGKAYSDPVFAVAIDSESEYSATLLSLWQEYYAKLVKCDPAEFDALFAQYSQEFLDAGYQEIMDERLEAYEAGNTTHIPDLSK